MNAIKEAIILAANYYGRQLQPQVLEMYADDLSDLEPASVVEAYKTYRRDPKNKNFPLPAQIREIVQPDETVDVQAQAREIALRIVGAVTKFGWCNGRAAEEFIGPIGWGAVNRAGGWRHLCENLGLSISPSAFQAQMRDLLEGEIKFGSQALEASIHRLPDRRDRKELERLDYVKFLNKPENPA